MEKIQMKYCPYCANKLAERTVEARCYLACVECEFTHWNNPVPVVAAIVELNEKIVLAHNKAWPAKMLALITGFLEQNEYPDKAIEREVKEELGLDSIQTSLVDVFLLKRQNKVLIAYHLNGRGNILLGNNRAGSLRLDCF